MRELYLPYKFELLLRGSRDGFSPKTFHELCDNKINTVTFIKVKGTGEILGGYNPTTWKSSGFWGQTKYSFIFSFKNKDNVFKDGIISNVKYKYYSGYYSNKSIYSGPRFGNDLVLDGYNESEDYNHCYYQQKHYEKKIREESNFIMEDYEVFEVSGKNG